MGNRFVSLNNEIIRSELANSGDDIYLLNIFNNIHRLTKTDIELQNKFIYKEYISKIKEVYFPQYSENEFTRCYAFLEPINIYGKNSKIYNYIFVYIRDDKRIDELNDFYDEYKSLLSLN